MHKDNSKQQALIDDLFSPGYRTSYKNWLRTHNCEKEYTFHWRKGEECPQPLYYAALLGFYNSVRKLLKDGAIIKEEGSTGNVILAATQNC